MGTAKAKARYTPEDLLTMPNGELCELVDGELVERTGSAWSSYVAGTLGRLLRIHCDARSLGWVFPGGVTYQCFPGSPGMVRRADLSFVRLDRLSAEEARAPGHTAIAPDLAVEVVSPNDNAYEPDRKVQLYLEAGVRLVWVVNPESRSVHVFRADATVTVVREKDELTGKEVVPGFRCRVGDLFRVPTATGNDAAEKA
jgi:Uma2 family endonuclease